MLDYTITIKGPGGVIDNEAYLIRDLLVSKGATVEIINPDASPEHPEAWRDDLSGINVKIHVNGQPWGG